MAFHVALGTWIWVANSVKPDVDTDRMEVRLIEPDVPVPALPEPYHRSPPTNASRPGQIHYTQEKVSVVPATPNERTANISPSLLSPSPTSLNLFLPDGSLRLPDEIGSQKVPVNHFAQAIVRPSRLMTALRPVKIRPNYFSKFWIDHGWEPLDDVGEALAKHLTRRIEFRDKYGGRYACEWRLTIVVCTDIPPDVYSEKKEHWKPATVLDEE